MKVNYELNNKEILEALNFVDCKTLDYNDWLKVGTALKTEGFNFEVWDRWSQKDSERYNGNEMLNKWNSFKAGSVTAGTIFRLAQMNGYTKSHNFVKQEENENYELDEGMLKQAKIKAYYEHMKELDEQERLETEPAGNDFVSLSEANLSTSNPVKEYLESRCISLDTARKYHLGATTNRNNEEMLVIPNANGYVTRYLDDSHENRYYKQGNGLFNQEALEEDNKKPIFVTEGQIDALSILQEGYKALALCSATNANLLIRAVKGKLKLAPIILCLDNDEDGIKATKAIKSQIDAYTLEIPTDYKDINEWYIKDKNKLKTALNEAYEACEKLEQEKLERYLENESPLGTIDKLFCKEEYINPIPTEFKELDKYLEGGLYGELYTLGAGSGEGKTAFSLQMMDSIAKAGNDVIIISLEMSEKETIARSLSRLTFEINETMNVYGSTSYAKTEVGITNLNRYKNYSENELLVINKAREMYQEYARHIHIIEGVGSIGVEQVRSIIERHIKLTGNIPVVLIDYLQLLAPIDMRSTDKQNTDKNILELKRMTRDYQVPILLVSSLNRASYNDKISMSSFKESGAIEYTSTVVIALEAKEDDKQTNTRDIELTILKNRKGSKGTIKFKYHYLFGKYEEEKLKLEINGIKEKKSRTLPPR